MDPFDLIVIGSGPGGYVAAIRAAQLGLKTACIDKNAALGGTCLNVGCIPSKTLLHSTELFWKLLHEGKELGIRGEKLLFDFGVAMQRKETVIRNFNEGIAALFKKNKILSFTGHATLLTPTSIQVGSETLSAKNILLATGSEPIPLPFLPFDEKKVLSSTGALALDRVPKKMIVVGAGVIGVELGSVYQRLGCEVVFVEFMDRICPIYDEMLSKGLQDSLTKQGMQFHLSSKVVSGQNTDKGVELQIEKADKSKLTLSADVVLVSIGRRPYTQNLGLERVGITPNPKGFIPVNGSFRTSQPTIFAIGDLIDGPMLAHKASEEGIAVAEILAGQKPRVEYLAIPSIVYTYPEVASVGMTEAEAKSLGLTVNSGLFSFKACSRSRCNHEEEGFVKMIADSSTGRLLGVHILGAHASELIAQAAVAIQKRLTALDIAHTPHAHPTLAEALKEAALALHKRAIHK
ncbi:MAG: dihydrolipoyl dehydrogenase [Chlamydiales bacterium]|nr:dihydrolipoyl dehydrogenase [Chlamydiales bacterium]